MNAGRIFHVVKSAPENRLREYWDLCAKTASADPAGAAAGMAKIAIDVWAHAVERGERPVIDRANREAVAESFGSSVIAHLTAEKLAEEGAITRAQCNAIQQHIKLSAIVDLHMMCKQADGMMGDPSQMPPQEDPSQMAQQGDPSQMAQQGDPAQGQPPEPETIGQQGSEQAGMVEDLDRAQNTIKNLLFMAQQVQRPALAQQIQEQSEMLLDHFSKGNNYLPPEFQHHFSDSAHAAEFMKKYQQRFGPLGAKSSSKKSG